MSFQIQQLETLETMLAQHHFILHLYPKMSVQDYEELLQQMIPHHYKQIIISDENKIVGLSGYWVTHRLWCGKYVDVDNVIVHPDYRSKGIGKLMMQWIEEEGKRLGCNISVLDVYVDNFKAQKFYYREDYIARGYHFLKPLHLKTGDARNLWND